ncbi:MAG: PQQ-like beta-propeller repeat protein [Acidimicrobiia bacterium]|nr:PQQ-like beta-propeller repeat protein [Acidimicrobiia bacterium]
MRRRRRRSLVPSWLLPGLLCLCAVGTAGALKVHFDELLTAAEAAGPGAVAGPTVAAPGRGGLSGYEAGRTPDTAPRSDDVEGNSLDSEPLEGGPASDPGAGGGQPGDRPPLQSGIADPGQLAAAAGIGAGANLDLSAPSPSLDSTGSTIRPTAGSGADGEGRTLGLVRAQLGTDPTLWVNPRSSQRPWSDLGGIEGLLTFRGNPTRSWYGRGPVPDQPTVQWSVDIGCSQSAVGSDAKVWCGTGWTGQPAVFRSPVTSQWTLAFGAYNRAVNFLDPATGANAMSPFHTGDIIKGSVTVDPDGYPLLYTGSRDNFFHIVALDRGQPTELWNLSAYAVQPTLWNNDWDGSALVIDDYLFEGGENGRFFVVKLNRGYGPDGKVTVAPQIVFTTETWDTELLNALGDLDVSVENSVAISGNTVYFANSGGLVQGWDISGLKAGLAPTRVLRFWTGDDTDASLVVDGEGMLYAVSEYERGNARSQEVGQIMKLDPSRPDDPLVWSMQARAGLESGVWATPALYTEPGGRGTTLIVPTNEGSVLALDTATGAERWRLALQGPLWSSPVVVDGTLIQGDCAGSLHAFDLAGRPVGSVPAEQWSAYLGGCIESTPAVWDGQIFVGTRMGRFFALSDSVAAG